MSKRKRILSFVLALSMVLSMFAGVLTVSASPPGWGGPDGSTPWVFSPRMFGYSGFGGFGDEVVPFDLHFELPGIADWGYRDGAWSEFLGGNPLAPIQPARVGHEPEDPNIAPAFWMQYQRPVASESPLASNVRENIREGRQFANLGTNDIDIALVSVERNVGNGWVEIIDDVDHPLGHLFPVFVYDHQPLLDVSTGYPPSETGNIDEGVEGIISRLQVTPVDALEPGVYRGTFRASREITEYHFEWTWVPPTWQMIGPSNYTLNPNTGLWLGGHAAEHHAGFTQVTTFEQYVYIDVYFAVHDGRAGVIAASNAVLSDGNIFFGARTLEDPEFDEAAITLRNLGFGGAPPIIPGFPGFPLAEASLTGVHVRLAEGPYSWAFDIDDSTILRTSDATWGLYRNHGDHLAWPGVPTINTGFDHTGSGLDVVLANGGPNALHWPEHAEHIVRISPMPWSVMESIFGFELSEFRSYTFTEYIYLESFRLFEPLVVPVSFTVRAEYVDAAINDSDMVFATVVYNTIPHAAPASQSRLLSNMGYLNLTNVVAEIVGANPEAFDVTNQGPATVMPRRQGRTQTAPPQLGVNNNTRLFEVTPTAGLAPGVYEAILMINADELDEPIEIVLKYEVRGILITNPEDRVVDFGSEELGYAPVDYVRITLLNPSEDHSLNRINVDFVGPFNNSFEMDSTRGFPAVATQVGPHAGREYTGIVGAEDEVYVYVRPINGLALNEYSAYLRVRFESVPPLPAVPHFVEMGRVELNFAVTTPSLTTGIAIEGNGNFGTVSQNAPLPSAREITIVNEGAPLLGVNIVGIEGPHAAMFAYDTDFVTGTLPVNGEIEVEVRLVPNSSAVLGNFEAYLVVGTHLGQIRIPLTFAVVDEAGDVYDWFTNFPYLYINGVRWTNEGIFFKPNPWFPANHGSPNIYVQFGPGGVIMGPANGPHVGYGIFHHGTRELGWTEYEGDWFYGTANDIKTGSAMIENPWYVEFPDTGKEDVRMVFSPDGVLQGLAYGIFSDHFYRFGLRADQFAVLYNNDSYIDAFVYLGWLPHGNGQSEWIFVRANGSVVGLVGANYVDLPSLWPDVHAGLIRVFFNTTTGFFTGWDNMVFL